MITAEDAAINDPIFKNRFMIFFTSRIIPSHIWDFIGVKLSDVK